MLSHIRELLDAKPFEPFFIVTSAGKRYRVASPEHVATTPKGGQIFVGFDDDSSVTLSLLHVAAVEKDAPQAV